MTLEFCEPFDESTAGDELDIVDPGTEGNALLSCAPQHDEGRDL